MLSVFQSHGAGAHLAVLFVQQDIQCEMLHVGKVDNLSVPLLLLHPPVEVQCQIDQGGHRLPALPSLSGRKLQRRGEEMLQKRLYAVLYSCPQLLGQLPLLGRYRIIFSGGQPPEGYP